METCLDEGTLQAYLDGELSPETLNGVAVHLSACATCAAAARAAEQELALFSTAYAHALPASVPTAQLRARLDVAIAEMNAPQRGFATVPVAATTARLRSFYASIVASLTTFAPRQATAFASFLVAVALAVVFFALVRTPDGRKATSGEVARNEQTPASPAPVLNRETPDDIAAQPKPAKEFNSPASTTTSATARREERPVFVKAGFVRPQAATTREERGNAPEAANATVAAAPKAEPVLEDEKTYISSIASLTSAIESQGSAGLTPTLRAEYERNLAVVNQAIISSRVAARRNPQDTDAKEFLRAAYQNKVELLSAVADQAQIASSRD
jgi:anti-sigma factor RsiW